jgi:hypothetical protein
MIMPMNRTCPCCLWSRLDHRRERRHAEEGWPVPNAVLSATVAESTFGDQTRERISPMKKVKANSTETRLRLFVMHMKPNACPETMMKI